MTVLRLGNTAPVRTYKTEDGSTIRTAAPEYGNQITTVLYPAGALQAGASELALSTNNDRVLSRIGRGLSGGAKGYALAIRDLEDLWWSNHSDDPPEWIESDDPAFAKAVASYFSEGDHKCVVGRPDGWQTTADDVDVPVDPVVQLRWQFVNGEIDVAEFEKRLSAVLKEQDKPPIGGGALLFYEDFKDGKWLERWRPVEFSEEFQRRWREARLITNGGTDVVLNASFGTAVQPAAINYVAFTANATAPAAGDTALTGEITTAGGGLLRGQATYAHTTGTNTATLTRTVTGNASDAYPVTIAKIGVFNAATGGTMGIESLMNATATLSASGDSLTVTDTITRS